MNIAFKTKKTTFNRGDIFYVEQSYDRFGCEMEAGRPAVIVSNEMANEHSPVVQVVYMTSSKKKPLPTHVYISRVPHPGTVLCEQIDPVDKSRFGEYLGTLTKEEMDRVDMALAVSIGLVPIAWRRIYKIWSEIIKRMN